MKCLLVLLLIPSITFAYKVKTDSDLCELLKVNGHCILKCSTLSTDGGVTLLDVTKGDKCD